MVEVNLFGLWQRCPLQSPECEGKCIDGRCQSKCDYLMLYEEKIREEAREYQKEVNEYENNYEERRYGDDYQ